MKPHNIASLRFGLVAVTADWLVACAREGALLSTASYEPPAATEALLDAFPVLRVRYHRSLIPHGFDECMSTPGK